MNWIANPRPMKDGFPVEVLQGRKSGKGQDFTGEDTEEQENQGNRQNVSF